MAHKTEKNLLGVAGEFAVAAELCRRNIYAQPTFGNQKRVDLLAFNAEGKMLRLEVKSKQERVWPNCRGIHGLGVFLVFVDFANKELHTKPDFYVLSAADWREIAVAEMARYKAKHPDRRIVLGDDNVLVALAEVNAQGREYKGMGVYPEWLKAHKGAWGKIERALATKLPADKAADAPLQVPLTLRTAGPSPI